jgi:hypothetical protein
MMALPYSANPSSIAVCVEVIGLVTGCSDSMCCCRVDGENGC